MWRIAYLTFSVLTLALVACGDNIRPGDGPPDNGGEVSCFGLNCPTADDPPDAGLPVEGADAGDGSGTDGGNCAACPDGTICVDGACVCDGDGSDGSDGACEPGKTLLCHAPPGDPSSSHGICVGDAAVSAHLNHGDTLGSCP